ncbi:MAG: hypothetical protein DWQ31_06835 [Planctomycetota bacterium]|nr:MAG: hypothetical protein DWQ31_06835 [Planctomycetota bacterium]REJ90312.1 MAG: hypothetical protein DWQ35_16670 [Planctomycetota bacterium]REJ95619.1 MAG: hypothetical protein DWQ35_06270 [Planctomycetota bacterium]REK25185.1 MAG: hypothetical protein DWQ42_11970 [Planctomycetota bacterium]REK40947.1 MAG: hypothetical protein DWQ46_14770 [Planctomycetota bacterium]
MKFSQLARLALSLIVGSPFFSPPAAALAEEPAVYSLRGDDHGQLLQTPRGRIALRYMTRKPADSQLSANSVCCLFPLTTPAGVRVVDFAPDDHRHHRGVFLAWHAMKVRFADADETRADFWGWGEMAPTEGRVIRNREVKLIAADAETARLSVANDWLADERVAMREQTEIVVREVPDAYVVDLQFRLTPVAQVTLDRSAFGGFCVKARKDGEAVYSMAADQQAGAEVVPVSLPAPHYLKPETDWPAAAWYDYTIKLSGAAGDGTETADAGSTVGIAVIDHPQNPATAWHNLAAIAMINPCIVAPGEVTFTKEQPLVLRYRLVVHDGPPQAALLARLARQWRGE